MGLTETLSSWAVRRPHVLLVEIPGWSLTRISAERELGRRGWAQSGSPADADILLTCGVPGTELAAVIDRVWNQLPGPRVRRDVTNPDQVAAELDRSQELLLDSASQRSDARTRTEGKPDHAEMNGGADHGMDHGGMDHGGMDHGGMDHGGMDHGGMDHGGMDHGGMDHGGMDMPKPGGIGLAEGGADRDGLGLDVLHLPLGPVLLHWPAGLVVRCSLQGDVITEAAVEVLTGGPASEGEAQGLFGGAPGSGDDALRRSCARYCDHAGRLLALLEWERVARAVFRVRDGVLEGMPLEQAAAELDGIARRVDRSRLLKWSLMDLPEVLERLSISLGRARAATSAGPDSAAEVSRLPADDGHGPLHRVPDMITGLDLAGARLVIASLGLETAQVAGVGADHA